MNNSIIFFRNGSRNEYVYAHWDCCESLGRSFQEKTGRIMYVGIPKSEITEFFMIESNLRSYLELITKTFDVNYSIASEEELPTIKIANSPVAQYSDAVFIRIGARTNMSNKYFNVAYNCMRYIWYHQYTNVAIIATNLYNLNFITDTMDIFGIAASYHTTNGRSILPVPTLDIDGLLFFRPKGDVIPELQSNQPFNNVFYKYPIYFNPTIRRQGSFFSDSFTEIKAKQCIGSLDAITNVEDIPGLIMKDLKQIYVEYSMMKEQYMYIIGELNAKRYSMREPLLLSKEHESYSINVNDPVGYGNKLKFNFKKELV